MGYYAYLQNMLENMSKDNPEYNVLETHLKFMEENMNLSSAMVPRDYIPPSEYDVLLSDVTHDVLVGNIAEELGVKYLSEVLNYSQLNIVEGILHGANSRPMVNLVVSSVRFKKRINVIFLVDTGSPCLYLCQQALEALGFTDNIPSTFGLVFNERTYQANMSPLMQKDGRKGLFHDINLIGASFLSKSNATLIVNYNDDKVTLSFK